MEAYFELRLFVHKIVCRFILTLVYQALETLDPLQNRPQNLGGLDFKALLLQLLLSVLWGVYR